jgi:hypothetical protein
MNTPVALTFHTRYSTNTISMENTHPFVDQGLSLIHNGVIRNPELYGMIQSTNDSESILNGYTSFDVKNNPKNIVDMVFPMQGYWAVGVLGIVNDVPYVDIFKHNASLVMCYIEELEVDVFITSIDDLKKACKLNGWTMTECGSFKNDWFVRINALTGEVMESFGYEVETIKAYRPKISKEFMEYIMMDETIEDITDSWKF